jgi:hypothetical protein
MLPIIDFDLDETTGQAVDQRCHWMVICASLIALSRVLYVTVA